MLDIAIAYERESPNVVAEVSARGQPGVDEINEISINGRSVETQRSEASGDFPMACGSLRAFQPPEHRHALRSLAQPRPVKGARWIGGGPGCAPFARVGRLHRGQNLAL
jgi:hypothetical protein